MVPFSSVANPNLTLVCVLVMFILLARSLHFENGRCFHILVVRAGRYLCHSYYPVAPTFSLLESLLVGIASVSLPKIKFPLEPQKSRAAKDLQRLSSPPIQGRIIPFQTIPYKYLSNLLLKLPRKPSHNYKAYCPKTARAP